MAHKLTGVCKEAKIDTVTCCFTPWRWNQYVPPKHWYTYTRLHGVIHNKIAVRNYLANSWNIAFDDALHNKFLTSSTIVTGRVCTW